MYRGSQTRSSDTLQQVIKLKEAGSYFSNVTEQKIRQMHMLFDLNDTNRSNSIGMCNPRDVLLRTHAHTHAYMCMYTHTRARAHTRTHTHTHAHIYVCIFDWNSREVLGMYWWVVLFPLLPPLR